MNIATIRSAFSHVHWPHVVASSFLSTAILAGIIGELKNNEGTTYAANIRKYIFTPIFLLSATCSMISGIYALTRKTFWRHFAICTTLMVPSLLVINLFSLRLLVHGQHDTQTCDLCSVRDYFTPLLVGSCTMLTTAILISTISMGSIHLISKISSKILNRKSA